MSGIRVHCLALLRLLGCDAEDALKHIVTRYDLPWEDTSIRISLHGNNDLSIALRDQLGKYETVYFEHINGGVPIQEEDTGWIGFIRDQATPIITKYPALVYGRSDLLDELYLRGEIQPAEYDEWYNDCHAFEDDCYEVAA